MSYWARFQKIRAVHLASGDQRRSRDAGCGSVDDFDVAFAGAAAEWACLGDLDTVGRCRGSAQRCVRRSAVPPSPTRPIGVPVHLLELGQVAGLSGRAQAHSLQPGDDPAGTQGRGHLLAVHDDVEALDGSGVSSCGRTGFWSYTTIRHPMDGSCVWMSSDH